MTCVNMYILRKMPGMFLNVFFNYIWNSMDHVLENDFNFLWEIIIIEKVTGVSSITNAFVLAKAQSWGISVFTSTTFLFALLYEKGEEGAGTKGRWIWCQHFFCCSCSSDLCLSWALPSVRQSSTTKLSVFKNESIIPYFQKTHSSNLWSAILM